MDPNEPTNLTTRVLIEIRDELRAQREEHGAQLVEHGRQLGEIRGELETHRARLDDHDGHLRGIASTVTQILKAVEHGNEMRDQRVFDHESRITRLEVRAGIST